MMKAFPKSVFVLLPGVQDVKNLPIHYDIPFYSHFRVFVTANCVSFSVLEMNFWQYIYMFRQKRSRIVENVYREYLYRSNRKFPQLCLLFFIVFCEPTLSSAVFIFILAERFPSQAISTPFLLNSEEHKKFLLSFMQHLKNKI